MLFGTSSVLTFIATTSLMSIQPLPIYCEHDVHISGHYDICGTTGSPCVPGDDDEGSDNTVVLNIARTTLSSKVLSQDKDYFANLAVDAVLRLRGSTDLEHIQIIKKVGGKLTDSYLDEGTCTSLHPLPDHAIQLACARSPRLCAWCR